ncbi:MAG: hypothetical protein Q8912_07235 [Bacillota bacterium]|nr:hypothetical protein [Bacillota bacterium]
MKLDHFKVFGIVILVCLFSGCTIWQSHKAIIIEKTTKPDKGKSVAVIIEDETYKRSSAIEKAQYLEDQKKYYNEVFQKVGITNYEFIKRESLNNIDKDYVVIIKVEDWRAYQRESTSIGTTVQADLVVTLIDKKTNNLMVKIAGTADNQQLGYNINEIISNLLKEMLQKIYM